MPSQPQRPKDPQARWWRPFLTTVLFSVLPLAVFLSDNRAEAVTTRGLVAISLGIAVVGVTLVGLVRWLRGARDSERAAVGWAAATLVVFQYHALAGALDSVGIPATAPRYAAVVWLALFIGTLFAVWALSRAAPVWRWALLFGLVLLTVNAVPYASLELRGADAPTGAAAAHPAAASHAGRGGPDVFYLMLDGYGRRDVLRSLAGYDNGPFLRDLQKRGFGVEARALTSYRTTILSQATTFSMDYVLTEGESLSGTEARRVLGGDNRTVASLRRLGYDYVVADDFEGEGCIGYEDICIKPKSRTLTKLRGIYEWLGTDERTFLSATPLEPILATLGESTKGVLAPDAVVREVRQRRSDSPIFVYAHIMATHAPFRYSEDCSTPIPYSETPFEVESQGNSADYATTVRCVNRELLRAIDMIKRDDPDAIILVQGDHGPAVGIPRGKSPLEWSDQKLLQRYAILSAAHFPRRCRGTNRAPRFPVNTFRIVLSCLTSGSVTLRAPRYFANDGGLDEPEPIPAGRLKPQSRAEVRPAYPGPEIP